jgi:DNA replication protein DnaC
MLHNPTLERLRQLGLSGMALALEEQVQSPRAYESQGFDERLAMLVDAEWSYRTHRLFERRLKDAHLRWSQATMEDLDLRTPRGLDRQVVRMLSTDRWINDHLCVLVSGPTGVGKSYIVSALAQMAVRHGHTARYYRMSRLFDELSSAKGSPGTWTRALRALSRCELLALDDFGLAPVTAPQARDLLEVIDDRVQSRSTVVASQLPVEKWHAAIQDPTLADAILDRLVHGAYRLVLNGESMRKAKAPGGEGAAVAGEGEA